MTTSPLHLPPQALPKARAHESFRVERRGDVVRLTGVMRMEDAGEIWQRIHAAVASAPVDLLTLDLSGLAELDGAVAALIVTARSELAARGVRAELSAPPDRLRALVSLYAEAGEAPAREPREHLLTVVGRGVTAWAGEVRAAVSFVGELTLAAVAAVRRPRAAHLREVPALVARAGTDAIPIVSLISFLTGFVMAYQSARQLERFGANIYVADLVGLAMARELGPLMTAIVVLGRSGAAFAAQIGSMKVGDEIDALRTMGLRPVAWLVFPRVVALVLVVPVLTLLSDIVGIMGGVVVASTSLEVGARSYLAETREGVVLWDVGQGIVKSLAFAVAIALVACQQGFAARGGATGVGRRTTSTVVVTLFVLVLLDALFTPAFRYFGR